MEIKKDEELKILEILGIDKDSYYDDKYGDSYEKYLEYLDNHQNDLTDLIENEDISMESLYYFIYDYSQCDIGDYYDAGINPEILNKNKELAIYAISEEYPYDYVYLNEEMKTDTDIILALSEGSSNLDTIDFNQMELGDDFLKVIDKVDKSLFEDKEKFLKILEITCLAFEYGSDELKNDEEVFFTALDTVVFREYQDMIDILDQIIRGAGEKIRNDRNIMNKVMEEYDLICNKKYVKDNYDCYARFAGDELKQNPEFILDTFEKYPNLIAFERTKDSFQDDKYYTIFDKEVLDKFFSDKEFLIKYLNGLASQEELDDQMIYDLSMYFSEKEVKKIQEIILLDKCKTETTSGESRLSSKETELKRLEREMKLIEELHNSLCNKKEERE